jgi:hypothetical protein
MARAKRIKAMIVLLIRISHSKTLPPEATWGRCTTGRDSRRQFIVQPARMRAKSQGLESSSTQSACKSPTPSTWPLAVRLLVITSSTAQNFETNARQGPMRRLPMMTFLLLVTWLAYGQSPSDYQVPFSSNEACEAARLQLIKDAERIGQAMIERATAQDRQIGGNNKTALLMAAISNAPYVSAVCVQTSAS